jgi:hypothetical protein
MFINTINKATGHENGNYDELAAKRMKFLH